MASSKPLLGVSLAGLLLGATAIAFAAAPPPAHSDAAALQAPKKDVDARLAEARARHESLQAQVAQMEQHNAAQQKQLQARDEEIAALRQKLAAAGVPAASTTAGH